MKELTNRLRHGILPECFELESHTVSFGDPEEFKSLSEDLSLFMALVKENTSIRDAVTYVDCFESGFLGACALALWFMEFDEDNWFTFAEIHKPISRIFTGRSRISERLELRLVKGSYPPMNLDQPVLLDFKDLSVTFLIGKLIN